MDPLVVSEDQYNVKTQSQRYQNYELLPKEEEPDTEVKEEETEVKEEETEDAGPAQKEEGQTTATVANVEDKEIQVEGADPGVMMMIHSLQRKMRRTDVTAEGVPKFYTSSI